MSTPLSLRDVLADLPDPRRPRGLRHPLTAALALAVLAMLTGCPGYAAIAQLGRDPGTALAWALGFRRGQAPAPSTFCATFRALDVAAWEEALARWVRSRLPDGEGLVLGRDGKTARGRKGGALSGPHLVAAYAPRWQAGLAQIRVAAKTNEHEAALQRLGLLPRKGCLVSGDALFRQRDPCAAIIKEGGDYLSFAKDNPPRSVIDREAGLTSQEPARRTAAAFSP